MTSFFFINFFDIIIYFFFFRLIKLSLKDPIRISVDPLFSLAKKLTQEFIKIKSNKEMDREAILISIFFLLIFIIIKHYVIDQ